MTLRKRQAVVINISQIDPTRTLVLRQKFSAQMTNRFRDLKGQINRKIVNEDFLGAHDGPNLLTNANFEYTWGARKVDEFMGWLKEQQDAGILEVTSRSPGGSPTGQPWTNTYIKSAYQKGIAQGRANLRAAGAEIPTFDVLPGASEVGVAFNRPFHAERVALIYTRVFNELKGVTATMDQQISRELALGMAEGQSPRVIASRLNDRVDKIGLTRARLIARTEVVHTHNIATLNEYEFNEKAIGEKILVQWYTARDNRVRPHHIDRHEKVYERDYARTLIGEPNCRCALLPWIPSVQDKKKVKAKALPEPQGDKGFFSKPEYQTRFLKYKKRYRDMNLTPKQMRDMLRKVAPNIMELADVWQGSTQKPKAIALKHLAQKIEGKKLQTFYRTKLNDIDLKTMSEWIYKPGIKGEYLKIRAMTSVYYEKKKRKLVILHRGTDGQKSGPALRDRCEETTESALKRNWNPSKVHVKLKENSLVGYSEDRDIADGFGYNRDGVTATVRIPVDEVFLPHRIWPKTGFMSEKETIVLGDLKRSVTLKSMRWMGKRNWAHDW